MYAWGYNGYGQLGSNGGNSYTPVQAVTGVQKSASGYLEKVVDIDVSSGDNNGYGTSIALTESKEVYGWGYSGYGQLGKIETFKSPIKVSNINTAVGVALGGTDNTYFTYILKEDGTIASLGYNNYGQLGNGKSDSANTELRDVQNLKNVVQVVGAQNGYFGAAVRTDGTVWAWGLNTSGQLGNSKNKNSSIPVSVGYPPTTNFDVQYAEVQKSETGTTVRKYENSSMPRSLSGGEAIAEDEQIVIDTSKLIGEQIFGFNLITDKSSSYSNAKDIEISSFDETLFTIKNGNTIVPNQNGKYGTGVVIIRDTDPTRNFVGIIRVQVKPKDAVATPMVSAKQSSTVALKADGTVWTWGQNTYGQLGNGVSNGTVVYPEKIDSLSNIIKIAAAGQTAVALKTDGTVWTWGRNDNGQLGNGTTVSSNVPVQVLKGEQNQGNADKTYLENIVAIAAGGLNDEKIFVVALDSNGNVYGFGSNEYRQLKIANDASYNTPVVSPAVNAVDVAAGRGATVYTLTSNGLVYALGKN